MPMIRDRWMFFRAMMRGDEDHIPEARSMRRCIRVIAVCVVAMLTVIGGVIWEVMARNQLAREAAKAEFDVSRLADTVFVRGFIKSAMADRIESEIAAPGRLTTIVFDSPGGELDAAKRIAKAISAAPGIEVHVYRRCSSACVHIFTHVPRTLALDESEFLFHRGETARGPWELAGELLRDRRGVQDSDPLDMTEWAALISPKLLAFFESCSPNPLKTAAGLKLRWRTIKAIREGVMEETCQEVMQRSEAAR